MTNTGHVKSRRTPTGEFEMVCEHCQAVQRLQLPTPLDEGALLMMRFVAAHGYCRATGAAPELEQSPPVERPGALPAP